MSLMSSRWFLSIIITLCCLVTHSHAQNGNELLSSNVQNSANIDVPSIPVHNDTSRDNEGAEHDSEPFRNNGRGSDEANSQNYAAENNGTHGMEVEDFQQVVLDRMNVYRRQMCANNLEIDANLNELAHKRAHDEANGLKATMPNDYNENVYILDTGDPSTITGDKIVKSWYDQHDQYDANNESSALYFTQLVWKTSRKLGVGHAYSNQKLIVVALYQPPGNIRGQFAANVGCGSNNQ